MLLTLGVTASSAAALTRAGTFSCQGTGANLLGTPFAVSNPANSPCATDHANVLQPTVAGITVAAVHSLTNTNVAPGSLPAPRDVANATASAAGLQITTIPGHLIVLDAVDSLAQEGCGRVPGGGLALFSRSSSNVGTLTIDGQSGFIGNAPVTIPIDDAATVYANRTIATPTSLTQIALEVDLLGSPIAILGESEVDSSGNPCGVI